MIEASIEQQPALGGEAGPAILSGARTLSHAALEKRARAAALHLQAMGVGDDDCIVLLLRNDFAFFEAQMAANMLNAYAVPANWHATRQDVDYIIENSGAKAVVIHADLARQLAPFDSDIPLLQVETPVEVAKAYGIDAQDCAVPANGISWEAWASGDRLLPNPSTLMRSAIIYTSGTTGRPKGVRRAPMADGETAEMLARSREGYGFGGNQASRRVLINGPMYHTAPNTYAQLAVREGASIILQPQFDAEDMLQLIEQYRITHIHIVPVMMHRLLKLPPEVRSRYDLSSLISIVHGAAPCSPAVKRAMIEWMGPVISEYYGSTETGLITRITSQEALARPGSVGRPLNGVELRILDDAGVPVAAGEVGDIYVRSSQAMAFSYIGVRAVPELQDCNNFVTVGDMGRLDDAGYLYISDRRKDMIISGGVNIYPAEIEAALLSLEGIVDCAVFGIPDEEFGEKVIAHVELLPGAVLSAEGIRAALAGRLARFKIPKQIVSDPSLPREDSGKVFKRKIRDRYWSTGEAAPDYPPPRMDQSSKTS